MPQRFKGRTILVLEDEPFIAIGMHEDLIRAGAKVLCAQALTTLESLRADVAALNFRVGEDTCAAVAERCEELGIPFVLSSGLPDGGEGEAFGAVG
jgi:hypothetical protein